ncbi:hypothetical protein L484_019793 [Morus notabilis]|uniref:Uncharacterized protein n=1 Tax=Morus notabilis TaxID=981085 RepID=W9S1S0_9ROSA|nr:hypothetical protein L484_019793 [Morus notabilis]
MSQPTPRSPKFPFSWCYRDSGVVKIPVKSATKRQLEIMLLLILAILSLFSDLFFARSLISMAACFWSSIEQDSRSETSCRTTWVSTSKVGCKTQCSWDPLAVRAKRPGGGSGTGPEFKN